MDESLVTLAKSLIPQKDKVLELGELLSKAKELKEFDTFCSQINIGIRKAYALVSIYEAVRTGKLTADQVVKLGWAKADKIASGTKNGFEAARATAWARNRPLASLTTYLRGSKEDKARASDSMTKSFHLSKDDANELDRMLEMHGGAKRRGPTLENRSEALMSLVRRAAKAH